MPILSQLYVYPVKSLSGFPVQQWPVDKTGFRYDRKWMLIDENGQFLSQRRLPKMALIKTRISGTELHLSADGQQEIMLSLNSQEGEDINVVIWKDHCIAKTTSDQVDGWLSRFLDCRCRLVYHPDGRIRKVDPVYALDSDETAFSDGFPFLIISEASLQALNQEMSFNLSMLRFRPNLVVADCEAYAEDRWRQISINDIGFRLPKPCSRCPVPGIDPETAVSSKEPLKVLAQLRQWQNKVYFGQNALHDGNGVLAVGHEVRIDAAEDNQPPL